MFTYLQLVEEDSTSLMNVSGMMRMFGFHDIQYDYDEVGYVVGIADHKQQVQNLVDALPDQIEYDIAIMTKENGATNTDRTFSSDADDFYGSFDEIDLDTLPDHDGITYQVIVYLYNTEGEEGEEGQMDESIQQLDELDRKKMFHARSQMTIKMKCRKGFKWNGESCEFIQDRAAMRMRIRQSVRTKRAEGAGYARKVKRARIRAMKRRHAAGL